jgi:hypothetical protein
MSGIHEIRQIVISHLDEFVKWPKEALLLWSGCVRTKYHDYPSSIVTLLTQRKIYQRNWSNDPAIHAYVVAGGERPTRNHRNYCWDVHHLYLGLPTRDGRNGIHAVKNGHHFTQSAGLIAVHPIADALYEEDQEFAELLRRESFDRFGYDPDGLFSSDPRDEFGFVPPRNTRIIYTQTTA